MKLLFAYFTSLFTKALVASSLLVFALKFSGDFVEFLDDGTLLHRVFYYCFSIFAGLTFKYSSILSLLSSSIFCLNRVYALSQNGSINIQLFLRLSQQGICSFWLSYVDLLLEA